MTTARLILRRIGTSLAKQFFFYNFLYTPFRLWNIDRKTNRPTTYRRRWWCWFRIVSMASLHSHRIIKVKWREFLEEEIKNKKTFVSHFIATIINITSTSNTSISRILHIISLSWMEPLISLYSFFFCFVSFRTFTSFPVRYANANN